MIDFLTQIIWGVPFWAYILVALIWGVAIGMNR